MDRRDRFRAALAAVILVAGPASAPLGAAPFPRPHARGTPTAPASPGRISDAAAPPSVPSINLKPLPGTVSSPTQVTTAGDGSGRLFVTEQSGTIRIFKNNQFLATPFLDIHTLVSCCDEQGLLSVAFHPNYATNGFFYVYYTNNLVSPGDITIARYHVSADPDVADPSSAQPVLVIPHPLDPTHDGGQLTFGADGYLWAGVGDGGGVGDPANNAQSTDVLLGKILRIDVNGSGAIPCGQSSPAPYAIPPDNPFASSPTACHEIWAYGFRNPWRFSFDRLTHDLLIGDVGEDTWEEIDFQPAGDPGGENYGWRRMEGLHCYNPSTNCNDGTLTLPILEYDHLNGRCAVIGGFRYRGTVIPDLDGYYIYGDLCSGQIWGAVANGDGTWTTAQLRDTTYEITSWGQDETGELYLATLSGLIYRVEQTPYPAPTTTGLSPASVIAGDPDFPLTVDGAGFTYESVVRLNNADRPTTFVSATELIAAIPAGDIASAGTAAITVFTPTPGGGLSNAQTLDINPTFLDVPTSHFAFQQIESIHNAGVTAGCGYRLFCPDASVTRAQMAVFLLKASLGSGYAPPACAGVFGDVSCPSQFADWIEDLHARGITGGCSASPLLYCPGNAVTRAQMAPFLLRTEHGSGYAPPACAGVFLDVPCPSLFADWIERLVAENITVGCGGGNFCPSTAATRAQMAVFLVKTFNLP